MKIVIAPNAFKGSLDGFEAADAIKTGIERIGKSIDVVSMPVADGGDGLVDVLTPALGGVIKTGMVKGPVFEKVEARFGLVAESGIGIVEMAKASGLELLSYEQRSAVITTTFGTGQLVGFCLDQKVEKIIIGLGGSATCDGGIGAAAALGYRFLDKYDQEIVPIGENLIQICSIDADCVDERIKHVNIEAVCDVANPLFGKTGASFVYSPQKGADREEVKLLDDGLQNLAAVVKKDLGVDVSSLAGGGAAGGLGAGVHAFFGARLRKGIEVVIDIIGLHGEITDADLVITGEGQIDSQTKYDKAPAGVADAAQKAGVPCIALCGSFAGNIGDLHSLGINAVFSICREPLSLGEAMANARLLLADTAEQAVRLFMCRKK